MKKPSTASLRYIALLLGTVGLLWSTSILQADPRQWGPPGIPVRQGHHIEWQRAAYTDANGYTMLVWSDTRTGDRDVYAQLIEPDGDLAPGWPVHVIEWPYRQEDPEPIVTDGGFIVTWIDFRFDSTGDVFAQKINYAGELQWNPAGVIVDTNVTSMVNETTMRGATDGSGGAIIAWEDNRNGDGADIYAQRIDANGNIPAPWQADVQLGVTNSPGLQSGITADTDGRGNLIVGWNDSREGDVYAAKIMNNRQLPWGGAGGTVVCDFAAQQLSVKLCPDFTTGGAGFAWLDQRDTLANSNDIYVQRLDSLGNRMWDPDGVVLCNADSAQKGVRITPSLNNNIQDGFLYCWQDLRVNNAVEEVYAQKFDLNGTALWGENGMKICGDAGPAGAGASRDNSRLTSDLAGGGLYVWDDTRHAPGNNLEYNTYTTRVDAAGDFVCGECGVAVNTSVNQQQESVLRIVSGADNYMCIYSDFYRGSRTMRVAQIGLSDCSVDRDQEFVYGLDGDATNPTNIHMVMGHVAFVWEDARGGNAGKQVFYQILDTTSAKVYDFIPDNGAPIAPENAGSAQFDQANPEVCEDGNGGFFCCFENLEDVTRLVRLQQVSRDGQVMCDLAGQLVQASNVDQRNARVVSDGEDGCFVAWSGFDENFQLDVYVMRMGPNCEPLWEAPVRMSTDLQDDILESLTADGNGCCVGIWQGGDFGQYDVVAAKVCGDGTVAWQEPVCEFPGVQSEPQVVADGMGGVYFAWADERDETRLKDVYGQHFNANGEAQWTNGGRLVVTAEQDQRSPRLAVDSQGRLYVSWLDYRNTTDLDVYAQKLNTDGTRIWPETTGRAICQGLGDQSDQQMLVEWWDGLYMAWEDARTTTFTDIYGDHIREDGDFSDSWWGLPGEEVHLGGAINVEYQNQSQPHLAHDWHGGTVAVWVDWRSSGKEPLQNIWANWVNDYTVDVQEVAAPLPSTYELTQNYPNPFNPTTEFKFTVPATEAVTINIYNTLGQQVRTLVDEVMHAGTYVVTFDASALASGVYFYRLETPSFQTVRKMQLIR